MARYHINSAGNPGKCEAQAGSCPFGADAPHFATQEDARAHFEAHNEMPKPLRITNSKLPRNAINVADLKPGMKISRGWKEEILEVVELTPTRIVTKTETISRGRHPSAGTVRLLNAPDDYDYHRGSVHEGKLLPEGGFAPIKDAGSN